MIRRFAVLIGFAVFAAVAASGQSLTPVVLNSSGCIPPPGNVSCGIVNTAIGSTTISVTGTTPAGTFSGWSLTAGTTEPPPGVSITTGGSIYGTPTQAGQYTFNVTATYTSPASTVSQLYQIDVYSPGNQLVTLVSPATSLPTGTVGTAIPTVLFTATGGVPFIDGSGNPYYQWSLAAGSDGLVIDPQSGVLSGTPTSPGTYSIVVTATDATGAHAQGTPISFSVNGTSVYTMSITTTSLPSGVINVPYSQSLQETGGPSTGVVWTVSSGTLPAGLSISSNSDSSGTISGTPTAVGTSNFTVQAAYPGSTSVTQALSITITAVAPSLSMSSPAAVTGTMGQTVAMQFAASGGAPPYTYSLLSGTTPPGLTLNTSTGLLTGTATQVGVYNFSIKVVDSASNTVSAAGAITISQAASSLTLPAPTGITGATGQTVAMQFTATGGTAPYVYTLFSGMLPPGLTLNAQTGAVTGTATTAGNYTFTIQVADSASHTASASGTITITAPLTLPTPAAVTGFVGQTNSNWMQFAATGGTDSYVSYTVVAGSLPAGLNLNASSGVISGQATQANNYTFIVQVTDSSTPTPQTATATASINISYLSVNGTISLTSSSGTNIASSSIITAGTQPTVAITLTSAQPEPITGTISVAFTRLFDNRASAEALFSTGTPFVPFTIAAGSTQAVFPPGALAILVGTAAGFGQLSVSFQDALGDNVTAPTVQAYTFSIVGTTPVIKTFTLSCTGTTYTASVVGYSSTLDMTNAVFNFTPSSNTTLTDTSATVALATPFLAWYSSTPSNQYGGQFMLSVPMSFSVSGGSSTNPIVAMTVTLTNSKGASTVSSPANPNPACQ